MDNQNHKSLSLRTGTQWGELSPPHEAFWLRLPAASDPDQGLRPARPEEVMALLAECLTLTAPTGMTELDRREWLRVAYKRLADIPADLLADAANAAQATCDHPAKIVKFIAEQTDQRWTERRRLRAKLMEGVTVDATEPEITEKWLASANELEELKQATAQRLSSNR